MATPAIPTNFTVQQGNRQVFVQWNNMAGATSYTLQRSTDGVNYTTLASPTVNSYLDKTVTVGTQYWYQVSATGSSGTSSYTVPLTVIPSPTAEMSLGELRLRAQQRADRVNSPFISNAEWNYYINQSLYELYDLLITAYEDYFVAPTATFQSSNSQSIYPLPDGVTVFQDINGNPFVPQPFYKLMGVDLGIQNANNAYVTVKKFNMIDRNRYVYPNTASTIYGVFNLQYRVLGTNQIMLIPTPSAMQPIRLWYFPRMPQLLQDTDLTMSGISGWLEYVIVDAAIKALTKEESDTSALKMEKQMLKQRIEESAANKDMGQPDTISDVRTGGFWGGGVGNLGWPNAGWMAYPGWLFTLPAFAAHNITNHSITNAIPLTNLSLGVIAAGVGLSYMIDLILRKLGRAISFPWMSLKSMPFFGHHILRVIFESTEEKMIGANTNRIVTFMTNQESIWNRTKMYLPRNPMCLNMIDAYSTTFSPGLVNVGDSHMTASAIALSADPLPTAVSFNFLDFLPKPINNVLRKIHTAYTNLKQRWCQHG